MDRFLEFLKANSHTFLFLIFEAVALILLFGSSPYRKSAFWGTAGAVTGKVVEVSHSLNSYTGLREANVELMRQNARLEVEALRLRAMLNRLSLDTLSWKRLAGDSVERAFPYGYIVAEVVGNTATAKSNYLTLNVGTDDGVLPDMGVVGPEGVVGVIEAVGKKYSKVLPLVNSRFEVSAKLSGSDYVGTLQWDGSDLNHSQITNLPKHIKYAEGDSIFTSGFSNIFPEHIFIGVVEGAGRSENDNFFSLRVKLATNFNTLKYAYVLLDYDRSERTEVETYDVTKGGSAIFGSDSLYLIKERARKAEAERKEIEAKNKAEEEARRREIEAAKVQLEKEEKAKKEALQKADSLSLGNN